MRVRLRVKEVAGEKGVSQSRLGRLSDIDGKTMRRIFHEPYANVSTHILARIANFLRVDIRDLLDWVEDEDKPDSDPDTQ